MFMWMLLQVTPEMTGQRRLLLLWAWALLMPVLCPPVQAKRGGTGWGGRSSGANRAVGARYSPMQSSGYGGGYGAGAPPSYSKSSSNTGLKMAGAAAAGVVGGAMISRGLSSMGQPRYDYGGYGYNGYERYGDYPPGARHGDIAYDVEFHNGTSGDHVRGRSSATSLPNTFTIITSLVCFLLEQ